jgi:hypothetical protein
VKLYNQARHSLTTTDSSATNATAGPGDIRNTSDTDDGQAIKWAINATHLCGGVVFFPHGNYVVNSTIDVPTDTTLLGGTGRASDQFQTGPNGATIEATFDGLVEMSQLAFCICGASAGWHATPGLPSQSFVPEFVSASVPPSHPKMCCL